MKNCIVCQKETGNPKFCSSSCAATHNNKMYPKRKPKFRGVCKNCGIKMYKRHSKDFCSLICYNILRRKLYIENIEKTGIIHPTTNFSTSLTAKTYMIEKLGHRCSICYLTEWQGQPTPLVLDHINGKPNDWRVENLRLVCPNCDAQLPTYKSKNKGNGGRPTR